MIRLRRSTLLLLHLLLPALFAVLAGTGIAYADEAPPPANPCRPDQLRGAKVTASAEFGHRGRDVSMLIVMHVYQMRLASVAFFLAQLLALATIWKTIREGGPTAPPPSR
ncbi:DUF6185 family protein [Streptomyces sp. NPDC060028]|uniref:DUF6185 family protein n=1 Tax=Streptomyces sp. NPDC060028 TaxID=3347041 RepID=UPI003688A8D7